jgi:hypothetical protein
MLSDDVADDGRSTLARGEGAARWRLLVLHPECQHGDRAIGWFDKLGGQGEGEGEQHILPEELEEPRALRDRWARGQE